MDFEDRMKEMLDELRTERDHMKVQIHLAKAEAKAEWSEIERQWEDFSAKSERVMDEAAEASKDTLQALKLLGEEIRKGYDRIKKSL